MTQLYTLTGKLAELQAMADTDDEGLKEALQYAMEEIQGEFGDKAESVVMLSRNIQGDIDAIDKEVDRLNELKRIRKNTVGKLDEYLRNNMEASTSRRSGDRCSRSLWLWRPKRSSSIKKTISRMTSSTPKPCSLPTSVLSRPSSRKSEITTQP